eukprot:5072108-Prymnesium_polylepis.2
MCRRHTRTSNAAPARTACPSGQAAARKEPAAHLSRPFAVEARSAVAAAAATRGAAPMWQAAAGAKTRVSGRQR